MHFFTVYLKLTEIKRSQDHTFQIRIFQRLTSQKRITLHRNTANDPETTSRLYRALQRALTSAPLTHTRTSYNAVRVRCGAPAAVCRLALVLFACFAPQSINERRAKLSVAYAYCGRGRSREAEKPRQLGLEVKSWVRTPRKYAPLKTIVGAHRHTRSPFSDERTFRFQSRPWLVGRIFDSEQNKSSWPCQRRSRSKTMSAEDKKSCHAPNGNGVVRTGKRPFIIGVSGGTASGKVGRRRRANSAGFKRDFCVCFAVDRVQEDHGEARHRQCGLHAAPGRLH